MTAPVIPVVGERLDLAMRVGCTFGPVDVTLADEDGTPVDLTGKTIEAAMVERGVQGATPVAFTVEVTDASAGEYSYRMDADALDAGDGPTSVVSPPRVYDWLMVLVHGTVRTPLWFGEARVTAGVEMP